MHERRLTGNAGEDTACRYLEQLGYSIIERNFQTRWAEIDIIAQRADTIYFIEVKTRRSLRYGHPFAAVSWRKLQKIKGTAQLFLQRHRLSYRALAVGVIGILYDRPRLPPQISFVPSVTPI